MWEGESTTDPAHESAAGTLKHDVSGLKRRSKRHIRLSPELPENATEQRRLLRWLVQREEEILESGTPVERQTLERRGVRTNPKAYFDTDAPTNAQRAAHSRALRTLAERGLILLPSPRAKGAAPPPALYVRLLPAGRREAARRTHDEWLTNLEAMVPKLVEEGLLPADWQERFAQAAAALPRPDQAVMEALDELKALAKRLERLRRDVRALRALVVKHAPGSPLVAEFDRLARIAEAAQFWRALSYIDDELPEPWEIEQHIKDELRRVLGNNHL